jgi:hypothetical protein
MNDIASAVAFMCIHNPTATISRHGAAIAPRPTGSVKLVSDDFPVLLESLPFSSPDEFPTPTAHALKIREPHVITVMGKAFYDIGHAPADHSNRRSTPRGYATRPGA